MQSNMGTQYRFTLEDTNRDGAPVPDVFVVHGDQGLTAEEFLDHLTDNSQAFYEAVYSRMANMRRMGQSVGKDETYKEIVQWWKENDREGSVADLIREWDLTTTSTYTVTVTFDDFDGELVITGIEAADEEEAERIVSDGVSAEITIDYNGPGDEDTNPSDTLYINNIQVEEEED